jgi:hypothetical protein
MNPSEKSPTSIPSMSKDINLNSKAMNNISYTHNDDKTNNELKMPYDEILRNRDSADEVGLDGAKCSTMSSFSPQVCMPSLNIQDASTMTYCPPLRMNVGNNQFSQMRNDVAVRFPVERTATEGHNSNSSALSEMKEAPIEHSSRPSYAGERSFAYTPFDRSSYKQQPTHDATTLFPAHLAAAAAAAAAAMTTMRTLPSYESSKMAQISDYQHNSMFAFNSVYSTTTMPSLAMEYNQPRSSFGQATVPPLVNAAKERKSEHHRSDPWRTKFEQLKKYKDKYGDVPPQKEPLGSWVNKQRMEMKVLLEGKKRSSMTEERRRLLESINFKWGEEKGELVLSRSLIRILSFHTLKIQYRITDLFAGQASWEKRFRELSEFKKKVSLYYILSP